MAALGFAVSPTVRGSRLAGRCHSYDRHHAPAISFAGSATLLRGVEDLLEYNPGITFRNDGSRSIDEIRIDTKMEEGKIEGSDAPKGSPPAKSWVLKQFDRRDFPLARMMLPGEAVNVQVLAGL